MLQERKVAYIHLNDSDIQTKTIPEDIRRLYLGGRGINMYLLYNHTTPATDPVGPENTLIIGIGLLTGTPGPGTSRCSISGKSPNSGLLGDSSIGGYFAAGLRKTDYDHLVISGKSETPVYILIEDSDISILDASFIWGKDTSETQEKIKEKHGSSAQILCIGMAGEKMVRYACVISWQNAAGRTGMGCLMGSKQVKAIVVKSSGKVPIHDKPGLMKYNKELFPQIMKSPYVKKLQKNGTPLIFTLHNRFLKIIRAFNGKSNIFEEGSELTISNLRKNYYTKNKGCFSCPVQCRQSYTIKDGPNAGVTGHGPEYASLGLFGACCGIKSLEAILVINDLLNRYGMDVANILAWATELFERGIIDLKVTDGLKLEWGNAEVYTELIHNIANRVGFGAVLADGEKLASERIENSRDYLIWSKNISQSDTVDVRKVKGFALGVATSTRGADHLRSRPTLEVLNLPEKELEEIFGGYVSPDYRSYDGKARMVVWSEMLYAVLDALGVCKFVAKWNDTKLIGFEELARLVKYAVGIEMSPRELAEVGERIINVEKMFLAREGLRRADDQLPPRYFSSPEQGQDEEEESIDPEMFDKMLDEYYELHGWDKKDGIPTTETLRRLDLISEPAHRL